MVSPVRLFQHGVDLVTEGGGVLIGTHDEDGGIVSRQTAHQAGNVHAVDGGAGRRGQAGHGFQHHDVLSHIKGGDALLKDGAQPSGDIQGGLPLRNGVAVGPVSGELLDESLM